MKKRILALLLLLIFALAACSSETEWTKEGKDPNGRPVRGSSNADQPAPQDWEGSDVDIGMVDGISYKNAALGITAAFPEGTYISTEEALAELNELAADTFDRAAIADAVKNGKAVEIFRAVDLAAPWGVKIKVLQNPLPDGDEASLISRFTSEETAAFEQTATNVVSAVAEADFCGQKHAVLTFSAVSGELPLYKTILYLPCGDLLYTVTVLSGTTDRSAELLDLFEAIH